MSRAQPFLDLLAREALDSPRAEPRLPQSKPALWIAVCLPNLPFDALANAARNEPAAVVEVRQGQRYVVAANDAAERAGIGAGCKLNAARALVESLHVYERSPHFEQGALEALAGWSSSLTSVVSLEPPDSLLLEVSGSLKLFGDLAVIKARLGAELDERRLAVRLSVAPTALGALWLARSTGAPDVPSFEDLTGRLSLLPLRVTNWPEPVQTLLRDLGVRTVGDCLRLPRDGFARRVGFACLHDLDRALGLRFDLRAEFVAPTDRRFAVELLEESTDRDRLLAAIEPLLAQLAAELRARQAQVQNLRIVFVHFRRAPTVETFVLLEPTHERDRLLRLVSDRLERLALPAPVLAVRLRTGFLQPLCLRAPDLFEPKSAATSAQMLLERLRGRFGVAAVYGMGIVAEHRPELAWSKRLVDVTAVRDGGALELGHEQRPLWLLPGPVPLESPAARGYYQGTLQLCSGPERIESGWWDEYDVGRDYYTAVTSDGQQLWIYRDRSSRDWHLHGLFG